MLESAHEAEFYAGVRRAGGLAIKLAPTRAGLPDRMALFPGGKIIFVELKADRGSVSPIQEHVHSQLRSLGFTILVLKGRAELKSWLEEIEHASATSPS